MRSDVVIEYRRAHPPRLPLAAMKGRHDDDSPPRPGGVPMRIGPMHPLTKADGRIERRGRIRSWRAAS